MITIKAYPALLRKTKKANSGAQILSLLVVLLWSVVAARTLHMVVTGEMFFAPCLKDIREKQQAGGSDRRV